MIKIFVKDGYVVYDGGRGPSYSLDNGTIEALYKFYRYNKKWLINVNTGLPIGTVNETDSRLTNMYLHHLNVPKNVVKDMYKAMMEVRDI